MADIVKRIYAGIGSRETPPDVQQIMRLLAARMEEEDWLLRTGDAHGADRAFMTGVQDPRKRSVYLPGAYSRGLQAGTPGIYDSTALPTWPQAQELARQYHGGYDYLSPFVQRLMARSSHQMLGPNLDRPADLVVAWTPGARITGGTGQALRMAGDLGIEVRNLADPAVMASARRYLGLDGAMS